MYCAIALLIRPAVRLGKVTDSYHRRPAATKREIIATGRKCPAARFELAGEHRYEVSLILHGLTAHGKPMRDHLDVKGHDAAVKAIRKSTS